MSGLCTSERAFGVYQTQAEHKKLMQAYRRAGMKRFHYTNSATLEYTHTTCLVSYYTWILDYYEIDGATKDVYMHVNPYVYLDEYRDSPTTTRQANRWLREHGFYFTLKDIAQVYENAIHGIESYPMQRYVEGSAAALVYPRFKHYQAYLNEDGTTSQHRAIEKVPVLDYDAHQNWLVRVGWSRSDKNTFGVRYE